VQVLEQCGSHEEPQVDAIALLRKLLKANKRLNTTYPRRLWA
jgi:hypothetical protein